MRNPVVEPLKTCPGLWGEAHLMYGDPELRALGPVIYVPFTGEGPWGLYDKNLEVISDSVDVRGAKRTPHHPDTNWKDGTRVHKDLNPQPYIYVGRLNPHFGHFIINSLPRLWPIWANRISPRPKLLCAHPVHLTQPFMKEIFESIGVAIQDIVSFDNAIELPEVYLPAPCLLEQYWVYTIFKDLCDHIGRKWYNTHEVDADVTPAYVSKSRLTSGVGRFIDEPIIERIVRGAGIDIFYPETMSLRDQVRLFATRRICIGPTGSAFHNTIFGPRARRTICYNPAERYNSNFALLDALNDNESTYLYQPSMTYEHNRDGFITSARLQDPEGLALELISETRKRTDWRAFRM